MRKYTYGDGSDAVILNIASVADTNPHVSTVVGLGQFDLAGLQLITGGTLDGAWKIEVSNDWTPGATAANEGQPNNASAHWTDITTAFAPAIAAVAHGTAATQNQAVQATLGFRHMRVTFTGSAGTGAVLVILFLKSWS